MDDDGLDVELLDLPEERRGPSGPSPQRLLKPHPIDEGSGDKRRSNGVAATPPRLSIDSKVWGNRVVAPASPPPKSANLPRPPNAAARRVHSPSIYQKLLNLFYSSASLTGETERHIKPNNPEFNNNFNYAKNYIKTSKYTLLSFVPYNLFEQFQRLANFYFLCLLILQLIPVISSLSWVTTAVPLIGVLSVTAAKDAYDDYQRHRSDRQVNGRKSQVLRNGEIKEEVWSKVSVGDIIRMEDDQFIAADVLILSTSEPNGLCYIETSELDGETNLKSRQCLPETADLKDDPTAICRFDGEIVCEAPNNQLNKFEGTLYWRQSKFALDNDKILLRGCILRNTDWCYGIVIFAGKDTKLMQNSGKTKFKRTSIDRLLNFIILGIVFFLLSMCLFCTVACGIWETLTGRYFTMYLPWDDLVPSDPAGGAAVIALLIFFSYAIVLNTVVPISLYVSVEVIRLAQSFLINWDNEMSYETQKPNSDIRIRTNAKARTTTLNEELGQIQYIFSDKTGTLTQNIMSFNKCSISGRSYGDVLDPRTGESMEMTEETPVVDLSSNPYYEPSFKFYDPTLVETLKANDPECVTFFKLLALCHTVMPEVKKGKLEYQAQSPDEGALVSAARNFGFVFLSRTPSSITISVKGEEETHELLCILDFNNVRKRMSVILRRSGKIRLYCKGADSIVFERIKSNQEALKRHTEDHLNKFAGEGLRTLLLAVKDLEEEYFQDWKQRHHAAATSMDNRELKLHNIYEEIEKDLIIIGATAIEDKLQDRVPQTIANLGIAGIKIWVLTGDKQETAINIGYSCQLLTDEMAEVFIVDGHSCIEVVKQLGEIKELMKNFATKGVGNNVINVVFSDGTAKEDNISDAGENSSEFAVVVSGHSLIWALNPTYEELFLEIASQCKSVICCRVTPLQKALVVDLVKRHKKAVTLAIGDGANDVSMIKTAHIGVGISGQEGLQAVLASDYSIAQFRFLERLLLVHGRWSYFRMCKFLRYFFYKNFAFTLCHFWFAFFVGFSAQTVYDPFFISTYNLFYTSLPVLFIGTVDQDVDDFNCRRFPKLYTQGHLNMDFNKKAFVLSAFHGLITSAIIMFIPYVYNLFYTSMPVLALGIFEQDVNAANSHKYPRLYTSGLQSSQFNKMSFLRSSLHGFLTAFVLFFLPFGAYYNGMDQNGREMADHQTFGSLVSTILVIVVTMQISLDTSYWTIFSHVTIWGSLVFYFLLQYFYNFVIGGSYVGSLAKAMSEPVFYFTSLLTIVVLMLPVMAWRFYWVDTHPTLTDKVRYKQRMELKLASKRVERKMARTPSARRSRRSIRSGYAFDHQEGFGRLITSGKIMHPRNLKSNFFSESSRHNGPPRHNEASTIMVQPFSSPTNVEV